MSINLKPGFSFGGWLPFIIPELTSEYIAPVSPLVQHTENQVDIDNYWLFMAFVEGMKNASISNPNPSVGCVVVKNNSILSYGCTEEWGKKHAERVAFEKLSLEDLQGSSVYVTLEPCTHTGLQPPCIDLFKNKGIKKVVIGLEDPNTQVAKNGFAKLKEFGIDVQLGSFSNEILAWIYPFYIHQTKNRPFIALKWAQSLDGALADDLGTSKWISCEKSRSYTHWLRQKYDIILVGAATVLHDFPSLNVRDIDFPCKRIPLKVIFDPNASLFFCNPQEQTILLNKTFAAGTQKVILLNYESYNMLNNNHSAWIQKILSDKEFLILSLPQTQSNRVSEAIVECLQDHSVSSFLGRPVQSIFVEGGARLLSSFIESNTFDLAHIFVAPLFLGNSRNKLFSNNTRKLTIQNTKDLITTPKFHTAVTNRLGNDTLIEVINKF